MNFSISKRASNKGLKMLPFQFAKEAVSGFAKGGRVVGLTKGQFSLIHLISETLKITGPSKVLISTWSAGVYDATALHEMLKSGLILDVLIMTDRSYATRQKEYATTLEMAFGKDKIRTTNTHAKFVLISNDEWKICIRSSMNLNENKRCENFDMDDDAEIFDFYQSFADDVFDFMPDGFVEQRAVVDDIFDSLMGGGVSARPKKQVGFVITGKNGIVKSEL
jgi:hypothetical protein